MGYVGWLLSRNYSRVQVQNRAYMLSRFAWIMVESRVSPGKVDFNVALKFVNMERVRKRPSSLKYETTVLKHFYNYHYAAPRDNLLGITPNYLTLTGVNPLYNFRFQSWNLNMNSTIMWSITGF